MFIKNKKIYLIVVLLFVFNASLFSEPTENNESVSTTITKEEISQQNINIDSRLMYGQYNNILSSYSLTQGFDSFIYQLSGNFKRSNDFGYKNSSFLESEIEFSAEKEITETTKVTSEAEVNNESHGMFSNTDFSREEKDRFLLKVKGEYKPTPWKWNLDGTFGQYVHRLIKTDGTGVEKHGFNKNEFNFQWENVISGSNRFKYRAFFNQYRYTDSEEDDIHAENEVSAGVKITKFFKFMITGGLGWNKDKSVFYIGKTNLSTVGLKNSSVEINYEYDTISFEPETFYFNQKYVLPNFDLPPATIHHVDIKTELSFKNKNDGFFNKIAFKVVGEFDKNNNYYNFYSKQTIGDVLSAESISAKVYSVKAGIKSVVNFGFDKLQLDLDTKYSYIDSRKKITYTPSQLATLSLKYIAKSWELEWENKYTGGVFVSPESSIVLDGIFLGSLSFQKQLYESFNFHIKIDNLYNESYSRHFGYAEPGFTVLTGLRIIL